MPAPLTPEAARRFAETLPDAIRADTRAELQGCAPEDSRHQPIIKIVCSLLRQGQPMASVFRTLRRKEASK